MKSITRGLSGNACKHCNHPLVWKEHKVLTPKLLNQDHYFKQWEACPNCYTVWFHEEYKVFKNSGALVNSKFSEAAWNEQQGQLSFLRNL